LPKKRGKAREPQQSSGSQLENFLRYPQNAKAFESWLGEELQPRKVVDGMKKLTMVVVIVCVALVADVAAQQAPPDLILTNGKIFTSNSSRPYVQALAIQGERITSVGTAEQMKEFAGPTTRIIDLGGRTVIAGINDAHNHLSIAPQNRVDVHFKSFDPSWSEARQVLAATLQTAPEGAFIYVDIGPTIFHDLSIDRTSLDKLSRTPSWRSDSRKTGNLGSASKSWTSRDR